MAQIEKRKRAENACCLCKARKIRCHRVREDVACTACSIRGLKCVRIVKSRERGKKWEPAPKTSDYRPDSYWNWYSPEPPCTSSEDYVSPRFDLKTDSGIPKIDWFQQSYLMQFPPNPERFLNPTNISSKKCTVSTLRGNNKLGADELAYLTKKGAFIMPPRPFRLALVRAYINYIHPRVPFVDIRKLLQAISTEDPSQHISILLLQAIFFAGSVFVSSTELSAAGYRNKATACGELFARARCLFDLDYEKHRLTVIKSLVLLSFWRDKGTDKDPLHWMGIAVSLAYTAGLHRVPDRRIPVASQRDGMRTWWSLFCRDRILSLSTKRAGIIDDSAFETPILTMTDFELSTYSPGDICALSTSEVLEDLEIQKRLALIFIENAKLSLCISRVLTALEFPRGLSSDSPSGIATVSPSSDGSSMLANFNCIQELESWVASLPATITELPLFSSRSSEADKVLRSHYCALKTLHLAASTLIYQSLENK